MLRRLPAAIVLTLALAVSASAQGQGVPRMVGGKPAGERVNLLQDVDVEQKLDAQVPLDLAFTDDTGAAVTLRQYFTSGRPVVLALVYYECPMLCTQVLNGFVSAAGVTKLDIGRDYDVVVVSFDPKETPGLARDKKAAYVDRYQRPGTERGWHFLTGTEPSIQALTKSVGFTYRYDPGIDQYAHAAALTILTPEGRVSRYLWGIEFSARDLRLALVEASAHKIGTPVDRVLLFCYHYDPRTGKYGLLTMRLVQTGGILTMAALGTFWVVMWRRQRTMNSDYVA